MIGYPLELVEMNGDGKWVFDKKDHYGMHYKQKGSRHGMILSRPSEIEKTFSKKNRPAPKSMIRQGRWDCYPVAIANLLGISKYRAHKAFKLHGWANDKNGATDEIAIKALKSLGYYGVLQREAPAEDEKCLVFVLSLNYKGFGHAISFNGKEMIDPNFGHPKRFYWGTEWNPITIKKDAFAYLVLKDSEKEADRINKNWFDAIKEREERVKQEVLDKLKEKEND